MQRLMEKYAPFHQQTLICLAEFVYLSEDARGRKAGEPEASDWPTCVYEMPL